MPVPKLDLSKLRHDLRGPINQIIGYSELLFEEPTLPEAFKSDLERIRLGGQELLSVIAEYLDDTRFIEKRRHTAQVNHDLRTPVNHIRGYAEMLEELANETGRADLVPDLRRIQHAATNWLELMEAYLLPGQTNPEDTSIILRVVPGMVIRTPGARSAETIALAGPARLVVVDDDEGNRDLLSRRLGRQGHQVLTATNGLEALGLIRRERPDLVLVDLILPGLDGYQVLVRMKASRDLHDIPVLMMSGLDQENGIARCIEAGADDYLTKPLNSVFLRARIGACLEKKRLRDLEMARQRELVATQNRLLAELGEATAFVRSLLPEPLVEPLAVDWCFHPSADLGGEAFGYEWLDAEHFVVYFIDVTGHGVGAALLSVSVLNELRGRTLAGTDYRSPAEVLAALNRRFPFEKQRNQLFSAWYGVYETATRTLRYASASHPPALLVEHPTLVTPLQNPGAPIGCLPETPGQDQSVTVPPGAQLLVFGDGVLQPGGGATEGALDRFLVRLSQGAPGEAIMPGRLLEEALTAAGGQLANDFTLVRVGFP